MFSHVTVGTSDVDRAKAFYDAVFLPLGIGMIAQEVVLVRYGSADSPLPFFTALIPLDDEAPSAGNGSMAAFLAPDRAAVDAAYAGAVAQGGACEGPPGPRDYHPNYYGAYFRDPDGNKLHVVCHDAPA